ncbi:MAG TPA: hypothetical protein VGM53_35550 [Streptosporangiaceae bacterium]|jgi:hypothetical protein
MAADTAAVRQAADTITEAARAQYDAEPHHEDFYALALATEQVLDALFALNGSIGAQLARYGEGRPLRTDTDRTPAQVLATAMDHGRVLDAALRQARQAAHALAGECARLAFRPEDTA